MLVRRLGLEGFRCPGHPCRSLIPVPVHILVNSRLLFKVEDDCAANRAHRQMFQEALVQTGTFCESLARSRNWFGSDCVLASIGPAHHKPRPVVTSAEMHKSLAAKSPQQATAACLRLSRLSANRSKFKNNRYLEFPRRKVLETTVFVMAIIAVPRMHSRSRSRRS